VIRPPVLVPGIVALVVGADFASKELVLRNVDVTERVHVLGPLSIVSLRNRGGAFSMAAGSGFFPWLVSALVLALLVWTIRGVRAGDPRLRGLGLVAVAVMLGGALGNQVDRWFRSPGWNRGGVVDFLDVGFWPVFNVADASLVCGALAIALLSLRQPPESSNV
jgi:signal peptidase II